MKLKNILKGRVTLPDDAEFAQASRPWNLAIDQGSALAVVEAADAADVEALVRYAGEAGVTVAAQASGHGATGNLDGAILLRTSRLDALEVNARERTARAGAGVKWGAVLGASSPHGLTGLAGSSPVVSVVGYTLGGGLSWFGRKYGLASESVRAFDIVTADGGIATITAESDPDLFWALRGGGGDYAIVTSIEFDLHPAPQLYGGGIVWPGDRAHQVFEAYREVTAAAPDELSVWWSVMKFPGAPLMVAVEAAYLGEAGEGAELLRRFEAIDGKTRDSRRAMAIDELPSIAAEPTDPTPGISRSELLSDIGEEVEQALLSPMDPLFSLQIRHLGGAMAGSIAEPFYLGAIGAAMNPDVAAATGVRMDGLRAALGSHASGRKAFTGLAPGEPASAAFSEADLARLRDIKRGRDPHGIFRSNFPIGAEAIRSAGPAGKGAAGDAES